MLKYLLFLPDLNYAEFSEKIFEKSSNIKFHQIHPVGVELFHVERGMDIHDKASSHFSQFENMPKTSVCCLHRRIFGIELVIKKVNDCCIL